MTRSDERHALHWYASHAPMSELDAEDAALAHSNDPAALAGRIQQLLIHPFHAFRYGVHPNEDTELQLQARSVRETLANLRGIDPAPVDAPRLPEKRTFGNCRHFTTLLTALLRERGVPARSRCGFGAYFPTDKYEDHWVTETWNADEKRWQLVDAQIDTVQREQMNVQCDTLDLGREDFWVAGQAWLRCRRGDVDPERFGILDMWGLWFVHDNVIRDVAALCKVELLPWDSWGAMAEDLSEKTEEELARIDAAAELTSAAEPDVPAIRALFTGDDGFRVPETILSFRPQPGAVEIGPLAHSGA